MVTLKDIAERLGVDISTVSRAINNSERVKPQTKALIKALAEELDYKPDDLAQGLAGKRTNTIGIIVPEIINAYYAEIIAEIEERVIHEGYSIILGQSNFDSRRESYYINLFSRKRINGMVIVTSTIPAESLKNIIPDNIPVVLVETTQDNPYYSTINIDNENGVKEAIEYLVKLGHRKIGFIGDTITTAVRLAGYKAALAQNNIEYSDSLVCIDNARFEKGGYDKMLNLLNRKEKPTAVFCVNDTMAIGAVKAAKVKGLKIPDDISVIGFDDINIIPYLEVPLTTVRQPKGEVGNISVSVLMKMIKNKNSFMQNIVLKPELIVRESTAKIKQN